MNVTNINNSLTSAAYFSTKNNSAKNNKSSMMSVNNSKNVSNVLVDKNYAALQVKRSNLTFKGLPVPTKPLSEKVGTLFNVVRSNDVILAGPSFEHSVKAMKKNIDSFKTVIKRVFFIEDKGLETSVAFKKNLGEREVVNLSDKPILISDSKNQLAFLKKGETGFLLDGDTVKVGKKDIPIKGQEGVAFPIKDNFTYFVEFDKDVEPTIKKINTKSIEKLEVQKDKTNLSSKIMFSDVGGQDAAIKELKKNILYPIKYPELKSGNNMNKSALLYGPPGTGKSLLAEACANESGAWYKKINASELDSKYDGESEKNWRELFQEAKQNQPAIIFVDEFDAIAKKRGGQDVFGDKTLNTVLGLMSDAEKNGDEIYMIAATNNRSALDEAATRSGRFGVAIEVGAPDLKGTKQILGIHTKKQTLDKEFNADAVSQRLHKEKATGADIASISESARSNAIEREHIYEKMDIGTYTPEDMKNLTVKNEDFDKAIDKFVETRNSNSVNKPKNPIGYNSPMYKK